jgi:hypothetical protein
VPVYSLSFLDVYETVSLWVVFITFKRGIKHWPWPEGREQLSSIPCLWFEVGLIELQ